MFAPAPGAWPARGREARRVPAAGGAGGKAYVERRVQWALRGNIWV